MRQAFSYSLPRAHFFLAQFVVGCVGSLLFFGCNRVSQPTAISQFSGQTVSGSMEPAVPSPRQIAVCSQCAKRLSMIASSVQPNLPVHCFHCGSVANWSGEIVQASLVQVQSPNNPANIIKRFDIIAFRDPASGTTEIKRVVGLPNETVELRQGDLWIDGQRHQKNFDELMRQSILVNSCGTGDSAHSRWTLNRPDRLSTPLQFTSAAWPVVLTADSPAVRYEHTSLWPKKIGSGPLHASPILDDYLTNHGDSRLLVPVDDIGILIEPRQISNEQMSNEKTSKEQISNASRLRFELFYRGACVHLEVAIESQRIRIDDANVREQASDARTTRSLKYDRRWLAVALCDGALWLATSSGAIKVTEVADPSWSNSSEPIQAMKEPMVCDTMPIAIACSMGAIELGALHVFRDIHYRDDHAKGSGLLANRCNGFTVLGDNTAISDDSRGRWPNGIQGEWIRGTIAASDDPLHSLRRQIEDF